MQQKVVNAITELLVQELPREWGQCYNKLQINSKFYQERRRGYWSSEAPGNLADMEKVPMPARREMEAGTMATTKRNRVSPLEAPPPREASSLPLRAGSLRRGQTPLARGRNVRAVELDLSLTRSRSGKVEPGRGQEHGQGATIKKPVKALNVHPRELVAEDDEI
jgi:hypothetical protein